MQVEIPKILRVKGQDGSEVTIDVSDVKMTEEQSEAFDRLSSHGDINRVGSDDIEKLKNLKAQIQGGDVNTLAIVRFDWKWVRID